MFICLTQPLEEFIARNSFKYDAIVVEGYDGVGKGRVLETISKVIGVTPYRPDYNLWQKYDHRKMDRWKVSGFFWDVFSHFDIKVSKPMLFDRGVISGAVYNDIRIVEDYKTLLRNKKVLHILVRCSEKDYMKFAEMRGASGSVDYSVCKEYTDKYIRCLEASGVVYTIYDNQYDESIAENSVSTCAGCGHYNYGFCRHPEVNAKVDKDNMRCSRSSDKEVQDTYDAEMQCV